MILLKLIMYLMVYYPAFYVFADNNLMIAITCIVIWFTSWIPNIILISIGTFTQIALYIVGLVMAINSYTELSSIVFFVIFTLWFVGFLIPRTIKIINHINSH